jgi:hypothetical protein
MLNQNLATVEGILTPAIMKFVSVGAKEIT